MGIGSIIGSTQDGEELIGGDDAEIIKSGGGFNTIITGNNGNDTLVGGVNTDIIDGGDGEDDILGGDGADILTGGENKDTINGGKGNDVIEGEYEDDVLQGEEGNDRILGGSGNDTIDGGAGDDTLKGGKDDDIYKFEIGWGTDQVIEKKGEGGDTLDFSEVDTALTYVLDNEQVKVGYWSNFIPNNPITLAPGVTFQEAEGTFTGNSINKVEAEYVENIITGTKYSEIRIGESWKSRIKIDNGVSTALGNGRASELILDFRGVSQPLLFIFNPDGSLEVQSVLGDLPLRTLLVTKVDENTKIYGGRFENIFRLAGDRNNSTFFKPDITTFAGDIIGSTQTKVLTLGGGFFDIAKKLVRVMGGTFSNSSALARFPLIGSKVANTLDLKPSPPSNTENFGTGVFNFKTLLKTLKNSTQRKGYGLFENIFKGGLFNNYAVSLSPFNSDSQLVKSLSDLGSDLSAIFNGNDTSGTRSGFTGNVTGIDNIAYGAGLYVVQGTELGNGVLPVGLGASPFGANSFTPSTKNSGTTLNPTISIFYGGTGPDRYGFGNLWGASFILEVPDVEIAGVDVESFYDSLDFSYASEVDVQIRDFSLAEVTETIINDYPFIDFDGVDIPDGFDINANFITAIGKDVLPKSVSAVYGDALSNANFPGASILAALDIETIIGASTTNYFFYGDSKLQGAIRPFNFDGNLIAKLLSATTPPSNFLGLFFKDPETNLDYSNYGSGVEVDADAGAEITFGVALASLVTAIREGDSAELTRYLNFGSATGVEGNFSGLDAFLEDIGLDGLSGATKDFAVANVVNIVGSSSDDTLGGNRRDNTIEGGEGADYISGELGDDTLIGGLGSDTIEGGAGDDEIQIVGINSGDEISIDGGTGDDTLQLSALTDYTLREKTVNGDGSTTLSVEDNSVEIATITYSNIETIKGIVFSSLTSEAQVSDNGVEAITVNDLTPLIDEALNRWTTAGYNVNIPTDLSQVQFAIADLPGATIGETDGQTITLDMTGAGLGWFVDPTPLDDTEFSQNGQIYIATEEGEAAGRLDLLTTIMHEFGHILGFSDLNQSDTLMGNTLVTGVRFAPPQWTVDSPALGVATTGSMSGEISDRDLLDTGLSELANWAVNFEDSIGEMANDENNTPIVIPFLNVSLDSLFNVTGTDISTAITDNVLNPILSHVDGGNDFSTLDTVVGIDATDIADKFTATVSLVNLSQVLDMDLTNSSLGNLGLDFGEKQAPALELMSDLSLTFDFGKDASGQLYFEDPQLVADLALTPTATIDPTSISTDQGGTITVTEEGLVYTPSAGFEGIETITYSFKDANDIVGTRTKTVNVGFNEDTPEAGDFYVDVDSADNLLEIEDPLDFELNLGVVGIQIEEGNLEFDTGASATASGVFTVDQLIADREDTNSSLIDAVEFDRNSNYELFLPVALETPFAGISLPLPGMITSLDLGQEYTNSLSEFIEDIDPLSFGIDDLLLFQNLSLTDIGNSITGAIDSVFGTITNTEIPLIDKTIGELIGTGDLDIVDELKSVIDTAVSAAADIQSLPSLISSGLQDLLGVEDGFGLDFLDDVLNVDLSFESSSEFTLPLGIDLGALNAAIADELGIDLNIDALDLSLGELTLEAVMDFDLGFTMDLTDGFSVTIDDSSGVSISFETLESLIDGLTIDIPEITVSSLTIPETTLGLVIDNGELDFDVLFELELADNDGEGYSLGEIGGALESNFDANIRTELPIYFPTDSLPLGGTDEDEDNDGYSDNTLVFEASYDNGFSVSEFVTPDLGAQFIIGSLLQSPDALINLTNNLSNTLTKFDNKVTGIFETFNIPLIGDQLVNQLDFFADLESSLVTPLATALSGITETTIGGRIEAIETKIGEVVDGIDNLTLENLGDTLSVKGNRLEFVLDLEGSESVTLPIDFDKSLPGLGLNVDSDVTLNFNYGFLLGFGFDKDGFYVVTDSDLNNGQELSIELEAIISDGSTLSGTLGFLNIEAEENHDDEDSGLRAAIGLDLSDADGRLRTGEFDSLGISPIFDGDFNLDINLAASVPSFEVLGETFEFPKLSASLNLAQELPSITDFSGSIFGDVPTAFFDDVNLDLGSFISTFMNPITGFITETLEPIRPLVEVLTAEIAFLKDIAPQIEPTLLGLASIAGGKVEEAGRAIQALVEAFNFADSVSSLADSIDGQSLNINMGSFSAGGLTSSGGSSVKSSSSTNTSGVQSQANDSLNSDQQQKLSNVMVGVGGLNTVEFDFKLLTDPSNAFDLLLGGEETADIFTLNLPPLSLIFEYIQTFPIPGIPGLNARLGGRVSAMTNLGFGFDTSGINDWAAAGYQETANQIVKIFDGFYLLDHGIEREDYDPATDEPEARLSAAIIAGASVGYYSPGAEIQAGVDGGIEAAINLDLKDNRDVFDIENNEYIGDGKIRFGELADHLSNSPFCLFNTQGELIAFLEAFFNIKVAGLSIFEARQRFLNQVLVSFDFDLCSDDGNPPDIAQLDNGVLTLQTIPAVDGDENAGETYLVEYDSENDKILVSSNGIFESFDTADVTMIQSIGTNYNDEYVIAESINSTNTQITSINLNAGLGDDVIEVKGDINSSLVGGVETLPTPVEEVSYLITDNDIILGGSGDDTISGGAGDDAIGGGSGNDLIEGGSEDDYIDGGVGDDTISGNAGDDIIFGQGGMDSLDGGEGDDQIQGGNDADEIVGGLGDDTISGDAGDDSILGDDTVSGNDSLEGNDEIEGGTGVDNIVAGGGDDTLLWMAGDDADTINMGEGDQDTFKLKTFESELQFIDGDNVYVETHGNDTVTVNANGQNVDVTVNGVTLNIDTENLVIELGDGVDTITVNDLTNTVLTGLEISGGVTRSIVEEERDAYFLNADGSSSEGTDTFQVVAKTIDNDQDIIKILGADTADQFIFSQPTSLLDEDTKEETTDLITFTHNDTLTFTLKELGQSDDLLIIDTGDGDDTIDASLVTTSDYWLDDIRFLGNAGSDRLIGSDNVEVIIGGLGADTITGNEGVDLFTHVDHLETDDGSNDTLLEVRDADFYVNSSIVHIGALELGTGSEGELTFTGLGTGETELLYNVFETINLEGGINQNKFWIEDFEQEIVLDGQEGYFSDNGENRGDIYHIKVTEEVSGQVYIDDTGSDIGIDIVEIEGTDNFADIFIFDVDSDGGYVEYQTDINNFDSFNALDVDGLLEEIDGEGDVSLTANERTTDTVLTSPRIYYNNSNTLSNLNNNGTERLQVFGRSGDDLFISNDNLFTALDGDDTVKMEVYGEAGNDEFFIGNVLETATTADGITYVTKDADGNLNITNGVSFISLFSGGDDNDYFEVNRNTAEIFLQGNDGDDIFYLKALLELDESNSTTSEIDGGSIDVSSANTDDTDDSDSLFSYISNERVNIDGGAGFDTLVIAGTAIGDTFYLWTEDKNDGTGTDIQKLYGAGLQLPSIENIERLILLTGAGEDTVYINGVLEGLQVLINTGNDSDNIIIGSQFTSPEDNTTLIENYDLSEIKEEISLFGSIGTEDTVTINHRPDGVTVDPFDWSLTTSTSINGNIITSLEGSGGGANLQDITIKYQGLDSSVLKTTHN